MPDGTIDHWMSILVANYRWGLLVLIGCIILIYTLEMGKIAFSHHLSWEKKSWAVTHPRSRYYASYLDFFNQLVYHKPSSIAYKLKKQFLKTLVIIKKVPVPRSDDYSFIKSEELREFLQSTKKWTDKNIGSFTESHEDPQAYLEAIGIIVVPFNRIINDMRKELDLRPVKWEPVSFRRRSYFVRMIIKITLKGSFALLVSIIVGFIANASISRYSGYLLFELQLAVLLFMILAYIITYKWIANQIYWKIVLYKKKLTKSLYKR
ncbi:MAG: hypothetical protein ACXAEU_05425 [Candidatus Hodarchaeales archaeon]|jgi:hypothetical protein